VGELGGTWALAFPAAAKRAPRDGLVDAGEATAGDASPDVLRPKGIGPDKARFGMTRARKTRSADSPAQMPTLLAADTSLPWLSEATAYGPRPTPPPCASPATNADNEEGIHGSLGPATAATHAQVALVAAAPDA